MARSFGGAKVPSYGMALDRGYRAGRIEIQRNVWISRESAEAYANGDDPKMAETARLAIARRDKHMETYPDEPPAWARK